MLRKKKMLYNSKSIKQKKEKKDEKISYKEQRIGH